MKKIALGLLALIAVSLAYCSVPLTSVATLTIAVTDQSGRKITSGATATYLDGDGATIVTIKNKTRGSWDNNLHWWSHSEHRTSILRPKDAKRAVSVRIEAENCEPATFPVKLNREYEALSFAPHGGGSAYFIFRFETSAMLQCRAPE